MFCFFFFKQKTAYEMRISDWSSDVCSSDLIPKVGPAPGARTLDAIAVITDHIGPKHRADAAVVHRRGQEGVASAQCRPVEPLEQPFFAAQDQILGLDLDDVPARVAADDLGPDHPDAAAPAILAQWNPGCSRKGGPIRS